MQVHGYPLERYRVYRCGSRSPTSLPDAPFTCKLAAPLPAPGWAGSRQAARLQLPTHVPISGLPTPSGQRLRHACRSALTFARLAVPRKAITTCMGSGWQYLEGNCFTGCPSAMWRAFRRQIQALHCSC